MNFNQIPSKSGELLRKKRPTVLDVAARAGVSRQTVTRAMNNMSGISSDTKARVLEAAKDLNYRPSRFGRGLVLGHQPTLGLVIDDLTNPYYPELAASVISTAAGQGWNVVLADSARRPSPMAEFLTRLAGQVDAIIGYIRIPGTDFDEVFGDLPVVVLETSPEPGHRGVVALDFGPGLRAAVSYLKENGRRRIVMIDWGQPGHPSLRALEYSDAMTGQGLEPLLYFGEQSVEGGMSAARELIDEVPDVDAIIAFNDMMAFGVMKEVRRSGLDIPRQCAVLGIDGLAIGNISTPELSSLALDLTEVGRLGVELVTQMYSGALPATGLSVQRVVSHTLVLRASA